MPIYNTTQETRNVESIVWEQDELLGLNTPTANEAVIADIITRVKAGELLLKGQLVTFNPLTNSNACAVSGIVTSVIRTATSSFDYKILLLISNSQLTPTYTTVSSANVLTDIDVTNTSVDIITGIITTNLGFPNLIDMKRGLQIDHVLRYIPANTNFISYF